MTLQVWEVEVGVGGDFEGVVSVVDGSVGGDDDWNRGVGIPWAEFMERTDLRAKNADAIIGGLDWVLIGF